MIPEITIESLRNYADHGIPTGGFLNAVLSNDLKESFGRADIGNRNVMFEIVSYCYNEIPSACWGSPKAVELWLKLKKEERENEDNQN